MVDMKVIRSQSLEAARRLGYAVNETLPLLEEPARMRSVSEVVDRSLALFTVVAVAHGSRQNVALEWLKSEGLLRALTPRERRYLYAPSNSELAAFRAQEEALWAFAWAMGYIGSIDYSEYCQPVLASLFPKPKDGESSAGFRSRATLRSIEEILGALDTAYCIHWAITDPESMSHGPRNRVEPYVIVERRRALEWMLSDDNWDDLQLDT